ncbi:MAG TPA: phosphatase PAP2 family protein [Actinomycetota bacterium]|nr:phosphatase PAP2 family protein [Actinomycetota bacterium]
MTTIRAFIRRRLDPAQRFGLRATLLGIAVAAGGIGFGYLVSQVVHNGPLVRVDTAAARNLHEWVSGKGALIVILKVITFLGTPLFFFLIVSIAAGYLLWRHRLRLAVFLVSTSLGGGIVDSIVKIVVDRDRPNLENPLIPLHGKSFPSGHAMSSTFVYGALLLTFMPVIPKKRRPWVVAGAVVLVLAIGVTRLALGVHYITDIVGGYLLGFVWLTAMTVAFSVWREERGRKPVEPMRGLEPEAKKDLARP